MNQKMVGETAKPAKTCFLCNEPMVKGKRYKKGTSTKDHIPPDSFFSGDEKYNLITVPCCEGCNGKQSENDDALLWLVFESTNQRAIHPQTLRRVISTVMKGKLARYRGVVLDAAFNSPPDATTFKIGVKPDPVKAFTRIVKGLLYKFYDVRGVDGWKGWEFTILREGDESLRDHALANVPPQFLLVIERGNGVFRADCVVDRSKPGLGLFFLQFFKGVPICVNYQSPDCKKGRQKGLFPAMDLLFP